MAVRQDGAEQPLSDLTERSLTWRAMTVDDMDGVVAVARIAFPDHFEDRACFEERLTLNPAGCFVLAGGPEGDRAVEASVKGYLVAYPWRLDSAPPLNSLIGAIPADAETLYLHDLALHPDARGGGHARPVVEQLADAARVDGWPSIALVAVNDAAAFWGRLGFVPRETPEMRKKLESYGGDARYMVRTL